VQSGIGAIRLGHLLALAAALFGKISAPGIGHPKLNRAQSAPAQGVTVLLHAGIDGHNGFHRMMEE